MCSDPLIGLIHPPGGPSPPISKPSETFSVTTLSWTIVLAEGGDHCHSKHYQVLKMMCLAAHTSLPDNSSSLFTLPTDFASPLSLTTHLLFETSTQGPLDHAPPEPWCWQESCWVVVGGLLWAGGWLSGTGGTHSPNRIRSLHDQVASGQGNGATSHPGRVGGGVSALPAVPRVPIVSARVSVMASHAPFLPSAMQCSQGSDLGGVQVDILHGVCSPDVGAWHWVSCAAACRRVLGQGVAGRGPQAASCAVQWVGGLTGPAGMVDGEEWP